MLIAQPVVEIEAGPEVELMNQPAVENGDLLENELMEQARLHWKFVHLKIGARISKWPVLWDATKSRPGYREVRTDICLGKTESPKSETLIPA